MKFIREGFKKKLIEFSIKAKGWVGGSGGSNSIKK